MRFSPLLHNSTRHQSADIVLVEGEIDGAPAGEQLLIAPYHIHRNDEEIFYVLTGSMGFILGTDECIANAGDAVLVPPGTIHTWWAASAQPVRYLIAMPKKLDDLILAIHTGSHSPEEMARIYEDHDSTLIGWVR